MAKKKRSLNRSAYVESTSTQAVTHFSHVGSQAVSFIKPVLFLSAAALFAGYALNSVLSARSSAPTPHNENNLSTEVSGAFDSSSLATLTEIAHLTGNIITYAMVYLPSLIGLAYYQRNQVNQPLALSIAMLDVTSRNIQPVLAAHLDGVKKPVEEQYPRSYNTSTDADFKDYIKAFVDKINNWQDEIYELRKDKALILDTFDRNFESYKRCMIEGRGGCSKPQLDREILEFDDKIEKLNKKVTVLKDALGKKSSTERNFRKNKCEAERKLEIIDDPLAILKHTDKCSNEPPPKQNKAEL